MLRKFVVSLLNIFVKLSMVFASQNVESRKQLKSTTKNRVIPLNSLLSLNKSFHLQFFP